MILQDLSQALATSTILLYPYYTLLYPMAVPSTWPESFKGIFMKTCWSYRRNEVGIPRDGLHHFIIYSLPRAGNILRLSFRTQEACTCSGGCSISIAGDCDEWESHLVQPRIHPGFHIQRATIWIRHSVCGSLLLKITRNLKYGAPCFYKYGAPCFNINMARCVSINIARWVSINMACYLSVTVA